MNARDRLRIAAREYTESLQHLGNMGPTITGMTLLDYEPRHRELMDAAIAFAHEQDRTRFSRGYQAALHDVAEYLRDNAYTTEPCARRIIEGVHWLRGCDSRFAQMEDAMWAVLQAALSLGNRPAHLERAMASGGKMLVDIEKRRLRKRITGPKRQRRRA